MEKISPLRTSVEAFNKYRAAKKAQEKQNQTSTGATNPFGIAFKGTVIQMDVFEKAQSTNSSEKTNSFKEKMQNTGKLLASAWVGTINKLSGLKTNAIAFGNKLKENTINYAKEIRNQMSRPIEFDAFKYNVMTLQNKPVSELKDMLSAELQGV